MITKTFAGEAEAVRAAREFVREQLRGTHADVDLAMLLTSELATDSVIHAQRGYEVGVQHCTGSIRVELHNTAPAMLSVLRERAEGGGGLRLVDAMASRWGTESAADHTLVWFELPDSA